MNVYRAISELKPARIWDGVLARVVNGERVTIGFVDIDPNVQVPEHRHGTSRSASSNVVP